MPVQLRAAGAVEILHSSTRRDVSERVSEAGANKKNTLI